MNQPIFTLRSPTPDDVNDVIYILKFKMSTADIALQQIRDKGYAQSYHLGAHCL